MHGENGLKFDMLMYHHMQNWLDFGHGLFIFLILAAFETDQILGFTGIFLRTYDRNGLKLLMNFGHLQDWLD